MHFSKRTPKDLSSNLITRTIQETRNQEILDLTESNPTRCGFEYPPSLLEPLGQPGGLTYDPHPFGLFQARQAVANFFNSKSENVDPNKVILTASTSEAYSYLFKLLGDPGDSFLVPTPGYPLLDHLLRLEGLKMLSYPLRTEVDWPVDLNQITREVESDCRGLVVVNPHNPTGVFLSSEDQKFLGPLCEKKQWAYISDEVFADFAYPGTVFKPWVPKDTLSFRLGGFSKTLGMPQLKLSWIVLDGPSGLLEESLERLELIADTYLSVNTPVQLALPKLLEFAPVFQKQLLERVLNNRHFLEEKIQGMGDARIWPAQGGWYAVLEVNGRSARDEKIVIDLLEKERVLVQPGGFYDFSAGCFLVISLLPQQKTFQKGVERIREYLRKR